MFIYFINIVCFDFLKKKFQSRSLFVKNLNFKTSDESLRRHFSEHMKDGTILSVKVIIGCLES